MKNLLTIGMLSLCLSSSTLFALGLEASIGMWEQKPSGYISYKGEPIDVERELRYSKEMRLMGRLKVDMPLFIPNLYFMATQSRFEGEGVKNINFNFGGRTFNANIPFYSKTKLDHYDIAFYYGLPFIDRLALRVLKAEVGINTRILNFGAEVAQGNTRESKSVTVPIPMVYSSVGIKPVKFLALEGELRGIAYGSNHYYDIIGRLKVKPIPQVFVAGGYRTQEIKIDYSDVKAKINLNGLFAEAGFEF